MDTLPSARPLPTHLSDVVEVPVRTLLLADLFPCLIQHCVKVEFGVEKHQPAVTEGFAARDEERRGGAYKGRGWGLQRKGVGLTKRGGAYKERGWSQKEGMESEGGGGAYKRRGWSQRLRKMVHIMWDENQCASFRTSDKLTI